jgi:hypothetical protein
MKNLRFLVIFLVLVAMLTACAPAEEAILTVKDQEYSQTDLEELGLMSTEYTNKDGETTTYEGVSLAELLEDANATDGETLSFTASDGYTAEMAVDEALSCSSCIVAFDDDGLRMVLPDFSSKLQVKDLSEINVE